MIAFVLAAALLALRAPGEAPSYDELVALGISLGREGRLAEAAQALDRAVAKDASRPEALVERGGLRFLEQRYDDAVHDLDRALALREEPYARDLLASSLHLAGRSDEAIASWNVLGQPTIRSLEIRGLEHARDDVARRELSLAEGGLLDLGRLRASRLRLQEVGIFDRVTLRPVPRGEAKAALEVALTERHGFYSSKAELAATTLVNALGARFRLRYSGLAGTGVSFGGQYRWQTNRPELSVFLEWPRPLGLPAYLHLVTFQGRQAYDVDGPLTRRSHGLDLSLRHVFGARTIGQIGLKTRDRTFSRPDPAAPPGSIVGIEAGVERRLVDSYRHRLVGSLRAFQTASALGSDVAYPKLVATLGYAAFLAKPEGTAIEPSVLAAQVRLGKGGREMPLDEMFAPGGSHEMDLPLRAHHQTDHGVVGGTPIGRSLVLGNVEWRKRVVNRPYFQVGFVVFLDLARIGDGVVGPARTFDDVGFGLRLAPRGSPVVRMDYGHGLSDGKNAFFVGLDQTF